MANTLRIKRRAQGGVSGAPTSMANAELAFNEQDNILYYGWGTGGAGGTATQALAIAGPGAFQARSDNLDKISPLAGVGVLCRTSGDASLPWKLRTLTAPAAGITITNPTGDLGNPTLALANDLAALEGLTTFGLIVRTADGTAATRTIEGTTNNITVNNKTGVSGNPTIDLATVSVMSGSVTSTTSLIQELFVDGYGRVTQTASINLADISLDQFKVPQANLSINSKRLINLADPVNPQDAATKAYVDAARAGLDVKDSCRVATTVSVGSTSNTTTIGGTPNEVDGITLVVGDRILVKNQSASSGNGLYTVTVVGTGSNGTWTRTTDGSGSNLNSGAFVFIEQGAVNGGTGWVLTTPNPIVIPQALTFVQFSEAGAYIAGDGMTQSGFTFNAVGTANRITVNADSIDIASTYVGQASITMLGTIATGTWQGTSVKAGYGGTGLTSYTAGDLLYAGTNDPVSLSKLTAVAVGNALISGGVGVAPSWGKIGLTTHVSGTLPIANGGTNSTAAPTLGGVAYGDGTKYMFTAAGTSGQALVSNGAAAPTWNTLTLENLPDAWTKRSVKAATTASITLSAPQTVDGVSLVAGDRVLVKNQSTASANGIYVVAAGSWTRAYDADVASELFGAVVAVDQGATNGGRQFTTTFKSPDTLGATNMNWYQVSNSSDIGATIQAYDATLAALAAMTWTSGTLVPTLTAADTITLKTVGSATGNILDKAAGDALYQPLQARLTSLVGVSWASGNVIPVLTSATAVTGKPASPWALDTFMTSADSATARSALGCLSMSTQGASSVAITGGSITNLTTFDGITIDCGPY